MIEYSQDIQLSTVSSDGNQPPEESRSPDSMSFVQNRRTDPLDEVKYPIFSFHCLHYLCGFIYVFGVLNCEAWKIPELTLFQVVLTQ